MIDEILGNFSPLHDGGPATCRAFEVLRKTAIAPGNAAIGSTVAEALHMALLAKNAMSRVAKIRAAGIRANNPLSDKESPKKAAASKRIAEIEAIRLAPPPLVPKRK